MAPEFNSTKLTIEIQQKLAEVVRLKKQDGSEPQIKALMARIDELARLRQSLAAA